MKKLITLALLLVAGLCYSQETIQAGLRTGASFPVMKFKSTNLQDDSAGFAGQGWNYTLQGTYFFHEMIGGRISGGLQTHPIQEDKLANAYKKEYNAKEVTVETNEFQSQLYLAGPVFRYPFSDKITFQAKMLAGVMVGLNPESTITIQKDNNSTVFRTTFAQATAFTINPGIAGFYKTGESMEVGLTAEYAGTVQEFEYSDQTGATTTDYQSMKFININLGVNYYLQ